MQLFKITFILLALNSTTQFKVFAQSARSDRHQTANQKLYINPDYARGGLDKQIFKSVTFIPLETTKESLFGKITQLEVTADFLNLNDKNDKAWAYL